jgi:hypothetical protein
MSLGIMRTFTRVLSVRYVGAERSGLVARDTGRGEYIRKHRHG